jgi:hypothetical protein
VFITQMQYLQQLFPSSIPEPQQQFVTPTVSYEQALPFVLPEQFLSFLFAVNSLKQLGILCGVLTILCVLLYLLFDKIVKLCKFLFYWGFFSYGVINFLRIDTVKTICLWFINKLI